MSSTTPDTSSAGLTPSECVRLVRENRRRWLVPTLVCAVLAAGYAVVMSRYWEASQALVVRKQATVSSTKSPGKFADLFEMRTFQETILELAKSRQVLAATLQLVGQAKPTAQDIEIFRRRLKMLPPGGAEFGKTEVFYFRVKDKSRDRAIRLVDELCRQLDIRLRQLRDQQAQSLIAEMEKQVELAQMAHEIETQKLLEFESQVGADLGELRMLHSAFSGQSDLRQEAVGLEAESRRSEAQVREAEQLLGALRTAQKEPQQLIAMPSSLLTSQPTLRRLKDGLVDAQLRAARLGGIRTAEHPHVQAAIDSVEHIRRDLHDELQVAIQGVEIELGLSRDRSAVLAKQYQDVQSRLSRLAEHRAGYSNRVSAVASSQAILDQARKQLSEVRAGQVAAHSASLVTPIDQPDTGMNPVGPGRATVLATGTFGGLLLGLGWVFLTVVPSSASPVPAKEQVVGNRPQPLHEEDSAQESHTIIPELPFGDLFQNGVSKSHLN